MRLRGKVYPSHAFENREIVVILTTSIAVLIGCVVVLVWRKSGTQKKPSTFVPPKPLIVKEVEPGGAKRGGLLQFVRLLDFSVILCVESKEFHYIPLRIYES
ncbi:hypothetical protein MLD38_033816 [Melastoma candidum]|uniref:Uncharacterized protein n=1 Tax=Melastoma candidum TaxID=119954 RepID=A0ACB9M841_9MYRT|nr:hypothetical protein MLD38_033816 [Melastoma candidum]